MPWHVVASALAGVVLGLAPALVCEGAPAPAADFCIAPGGDDAGPGTVDKPFATLARARDAVRARIAQGLKGPVTVLVRGGTYRLAQAVVFGPDDSGTAEHAVTYAAWPGERPVFSGGRAITGWQAAEGGLWKVHLPDVQAGRWDFRELFVGPERRMRARHPNDGYLRVEKVVDDRRAFTFRPGDLPPLGEAGDAELLLLHDWSVTRVRIASVDGASRTIAAAHEVGGPANFWRVNGFEPSPRYAVENHRALLDAPGEWFLDRAAGTLWYRPMAGESLEGFQAVAPAAPQLVVVRGNLEKDRPVRNLRLAGLGFEHAAWLIPGGRYAGGQACFHWNGHAKPGWGWVPVAPALEFEAAEGCRVEAARLAHLGGSGLWFGRAARGCVLAASTVTDVSGNGVMIGEGQSRQGREVATGNRVERCLVERCGRQFFGAVGVWVGLAAETAVERSEVRDLPYTGVSVGWMWNPSPTPCRANRIEANNIHHCMQILSDGGGIYTLGRQPGTVLARNLIHDIPRNAGRAESNGMFLDEGTTDLVIEANLIHGTDRSPFRFHKAGKNLVRSNRVVLPPGVPIVRYNATAEANITLEANAEVPASETGGEAFQKALQEARRRTGPDAAP